MLTPAIQKPVVKVRLIIKIRYLNRTKSTSLNTTLHQTLIVASLFSAEDRTGASTEPPTLLVSTMKTNDSSTTHTMEEPEGSNTTGNRMTAAPSPTGPVLNESSQVPTGSTQASTTEPSLPTAMCCKNLLYYVSSLVQILYGSNSSGKENNGNLFGLMNCNEHKMIRDQIFCLL